MRGTTSLAFIFILVASLISVSCEHQAVDNTPSSIESSEFLKLDADFKHQEHDKIIEKDYEVIRNLQSNTGGSSSSTSTHVNIFQKLKESLGLAIVGFLLICCAPVFIWKNEGRYVNELKKIDFCKNEAIAVDSGSSSEGNNGQLVYFVGNLSVGEETLDFGPDKLNTFIPLPRAILLKRTCYIYQKMETSQQSTNKDFVGGGETRTVTYNVVEDWFPQPGPAQLPHLPNEINNPGIWDSLVSGTGQSGRAAITSPDGLPPQFMTMLGMSDDPPNGFVICNATKVGEFGISRDVIVGNPREFLSELVPVPEDYLPERVAGCDGLRKNGNILQTFDGTVPQNGDCKVVYEYVKDGFECSFIVQQTSKYTPIDVENGGLTSKYGIDKCHVVDSSSFGQCDSDLGFIWLVRKGRHSKDTMIDMAKEEQSQMMKILRIICVAALVGGWVMLFSPFTTALQVLPILGSLGYFAVVLVGVIVGGTCFCTIATIAYVRYRPLIAFALLALAGIIWGIVAWRLDVASSTGGGK